MLVIIPPLCLLLQSSLLFPRPSTQINILRLLITPISLTLIRSSFLKGYFTPERDFIIFNTVIQICRAWCLLKAVEYGVFSWGKRQRWIGYRKALYGSNGADKKTDARNGDAEGPRYSDYDRDPDIFGHPAHPAGILQTIYYGWCNLSSLRGIGWSNSPPPASLAKDDTAVHSRPSAHPLSRAIHSHQGLLHKLLLRAAWTHLLLLAGLLFVLASEEAGSPYKLVRHGLTALNSLMDSPESDGAVAVYSVQIVANALYVLCFGICVYAALDCGFTLLTLLCYIVHSLLRALPLPTPLRPQRPFEASAWPKLMNAPYLATSLHSFWALHWHSLFRPPFLAVGFQPLHGLVSRYLGMSKDLANAAGVMGTFAVSGWMHEAINDATPYLPRDPTYRSFTFFILQGVGILLESIFTKFVTGNHRRVGGVAGALWTFSWLLWSGHFMADCWMERGLAAFMPPLRTWEWWRFAAPFALIFPRLKK